MKEKEIWIFIRGGLVQEVKSTHSDLKVNLIDYDTLETDETDDDEEEKKEIQKQELLSMGMFVVF